MEFVAVLESEIVPPPVRLAPPVATIRLGVVTVRVFVRSMAPLSVTAELITTILPADRVRLLRASAPPSNSRVPRPVTVPARLLAVPVKVI